MFRTYSKLVLRHLLKNRLYTAIKLIGLTVGSSTCLLIGLYLHHEITYDACHEKAERIAKVQMEYRFGGETVLVNVTGNKVAPAFTQEFPEVEAAVRIMEYQEVVRYGDLLFEEAHVYYADSSFFEVFTFPLLKGNPKTALRAPHTVVLTESTARRYFGTKNPLGEVLYISGNAVVVTGIMADPPANTHLKPDFVRSFVSLTAARPENETWQNANYATYLLLRQPAQLKTIQDRIPGYMATQTEETGAGGDRFLTFHLQRLPDVHLNALVPGNFEPNGDIRYLYLLGITALLILLIACTTYINLTTAAGTARAREVGVQKVLGAGRGQLAGQFLGESVIVTCSALLLGLALTGPLLPVFNSLFDRKLTAELLFHPIALALIGGIGLIVSLLAGFYPALVVSRYKPAAVLKGHFKFAPGGIRLRNGLVVLQFFISIALIICTLLLREQLDFIQNKKTGFDKEHVLVLPADQVVNQNFETLRTGFLQNPNVRAVTRSYDSPVHIKGGYSIGRDPAGQDQYPVTAQPAGLDFLKTMDIKLLAGADFTAADMEKGDRMRTDSTVVLPVLLNESQARAFGWTPEIAIGRHVAFFGRSQVKGVVRDFHFASLHEPIAPLVIFPSNWGQVVLVKLTGKNMKSTLQYLGRHWMAHVPHRPFSYHFLDEELDRMYAAEIQTARVVTAFTGLAILLACLGLFGLASYSFVQRTKEIGIRKVLGAGTASIVGLLSRDFLKLVLVAFALAAPVAWFLMDRWLQHFAYRIATPWWAFAAAGFVAVTIAFLTMSVHGLQSARTNPVTCLRSE
jgi:putative ABC transport system permease protein